MPVRYPAQVRVIDYADWLYFQILHHLELDRPRNVLVEAIWWRGHEEVSVNR
ncbi:MAG TPA: hypothetical protein VK775_18085 [Chthoniobacterales bacterium]|nr:hypothetical protein [Chthoniobacterales bacterium]